MAISAYRVIRKRLLITW